MLLYIFEIGEHRDEGVVWALPTSHPYFPFQQWEIEAFRCLIAVMSVM